MKVRITLWETNEFISFLSDKEKVLSWEVSVVLTGEHWAFMHSSDGIIYALHASFWGGN